MNAPASLTAQLREHLDRLVPVDQRAELASQIDLVDAETASAAPNPSKLRHALTAIQRMIRDVAVGAGGSLIAQGALALIGEALKTL